MYLNSHILNRNLFVLIFLVAILAITTHGQRKPPAGGKTAVVIDDRLSALRTAPGLSAKLIQRLSRGRFVAIIGSRQNREGVTFYHVKTSSRRSGWLQRESVVVSAQHGDDNRLLALIRASDDFEAIARSRIFLDTFPASHLRPAVLLIYANAAEEVAARLSRDATRRLNAKEIAAVGAPEFTYFLNYNGLDRYNRRGVRFTFDRVTKRFHYDGAAWREIVNRYPGSAEAAEARARLSAGIVQR